jgi:hypothetical protein
LLSVLGIQLVQLDQSVVQLLHQVHFLLFNLSDLIIELFFDSQSHVSIAPHEPVRKLLAFNRIFAFLLLILLPFLLLGHLLVLIASEDLHVRYF